MIGAARAGPNTDRNRLYNSLKCPGEVTIAGTADLSLLLINVSRETGLPLAGAAWEIPGLNLLAIAAG